VTFNIGSQQGFINNVAGDQTIHGGQHGSFANTRAVASAAELAEVLRRMGMDSAADDADAVRREVAQPRPDREHIAARLTRIAHAVTAVAGAESAVQRSLGALASWLGDMGAPILRILGL
jgi:hypothetical protein